MKTTIWIYATVLITALILSNSTILAQSNFEISIGAGWPDNVNLKLRGGNQFQIGLSMGYNAYYSDYGEEGNKTIGPVSVEIYYNFGGKSSYTDQRPWYTMGGLGYRWIVEKGIIFYPRIGRTFNFSKKFGLRLDGGVRIPIGNEDFKDFFWDIPVYPSGNAGFFYRF